MRRAVPNAGQRALLIAGVGCFLLVAGCRAATQPCAVDRDCGGGEICIAGYCGVGNRRLLVGDADLPPAVIYGPRLQTFTPSGPITLSSGQTVSGLKISTATGPCITGTNVTNVHIVDNEIGPCGSGAAGAGISLDNPTAILIEHNAFDDVAAGLFVDGSGGGSEIVFHHNRVTHLRSAQDSQGHMVALWRVNGPGNAVRCNLSDQGTPGYEDGPRFQIYFEDSSGTAISPIEVGFNKLRGGGPSTEAGGIYTGSGIGGHFVVHDNILVETGRVALGLAGDGVSALRNIVYGPTGHAWTSTTGVGLCVMRDGTSPCQNIEARDNRVLFFNTAGQNDEYDAGDCGTVAGWSSNTFGDATLDASVWETPLPDCLE